MRFVLALMTVLGVPPVSGTAMMVLFVELLRQQVTCPTGSDRERLEAGHLPVGMVGNVPRQVTCRRHWSATFRGRSPAPSALVGNLPRPVTARPRSTPPLSATSSATQSSRSP
jgi:hypothetical protein